MNADEWAEEFSRVQLPVLSSVMSEINSLAQADDTSAGQLSELILRDAALTSKVLRIANSVFHNPNTENAITTISRAVVQLGFQGIKAISLSVMLVDSLLKQESKVHVLKWMARGFHSAVQAENLIQCIDESEKEEVFITALMLHIGDMALWSMKGEHIDQLSRQLGINSDSNEEVENRILGTTIRAIGKALVKAWNLGPDLQEVLSPGNNPSIKTQAVLLAEKIALASEQGWESEAFADVMVETSLFTGLGLQDVRKMIMEGADKAAAVAVNFGANKICQYIPSTTAKHPIEPEVVIMSPDPQLQLDILREMGELVQRNVDLNTLFQMVVEGLHRGIGLERVALCLIDPKVTQMQAKYVLGHHPEQWREQVHFPVKSEQDNIFAYCLHSRQTVWLRRNHTHDFKYLIDKKMTQVFDTENSLIASVYAANRPIGILLADRGEQGVDIAQEQQESFCHFSQQMTMSLSMLASRKG